MTGNHRLLLFSALAILMWGFWGFFGKVALDRKMAALSILLAETLISALVAVPAFLTLSALNNSLAHSSWNVYGLLSGAVLALGLLFYYLALSEGRISVVVPLTATYPLVSVVLGMIFLGERPSLTQWLGALLVVGGAMLLLAPIQRVQQ